MDQVKIGKFIAENRKKKKMTQVELAEKLGITDRSVSKWETGRGMPDVSLFEDLCNILEISVNELLKGESVSIENIEKVSAENTIEYSKYLKNNEKKKAMKISLAFVMLIIISSIFIILSCNKTFFRTTYNSDFLGNVSISIPRFCYYKGTGGLDSHIVKLKTLQQPDDVQVFIDRYLSGFKKFEFEDTFYYYNEKHDFSIFQYSINNDGIGFVNTIYIGYCDGQLEYCVNKEN